MKVIGEQFAIVSETPVSSGGMADVFKARDIKGERDVAVKLFRSGETEVDLIRESFRRESDALKELRHPNIVELVRAGVDGPTGRYFLALEWVPTNLEQWLATVDQQDPAQWGWDTFAERIGLPLARALDFAHHRDCIHRDIKPLNTLMTADGRPKVADFGIAKLKTLLDPGFTLAQFMSEPYSPADHDHGEFAETRDVYAFAVLAVRCLSGEKPKTHADVRTLLSGKVNAPPEALTLLASCLSPAIDQRPRTGGVLLQKLTDLQDQRSRARERQATCYLALTNRARTKAEELLGAIDPPDLAQLIAEDLTDLCAAKPHAEPLAKGGKVVPHQYDLLGSTFSLHTAVDDRTGAHLVVVGISRPHSATLERLREGAWKPGFSFRIGHPANIGEGANVVARLEQGVRDFDDRSTLDSIDIEVQRLTDRWAKVLKAKRAIEQARYEPVEYEQASVEGTRAAFRLVRPLDAPPDEGLYRVDRSFFRGELDAFERQSITLYHPAAGTFAIPHAGVLRVDTQAAEEPLRRQERALDDVRSGRGLRSDTGPLLAHPSKVQKPVPVEVSAFAIKDLDEPKQKAVRAALGTADVLLVKGPPGTGKTSFIAETIVQERRRDPHVRVLLTSQTHIAIDNAVERLLKHDKSVRVVRWASDPDRVLKGVQPLLLENRVSVWVQQVKEQSERFLQDWGARHGVDPATVRRSLLLRRVLSGRERSRELGAKLNEAERVLRGDIVPDSRTGVDEAAAEEAAANVSVYKEALARAQTTRRRAEDDLRGLEGGAALLKQPESELVELADRLLPRDDRGKQLQQLLLLHEQYVQRLENPRDIQGIVLSDHDVVAATCVGLGGIFDFRDLEFDLCIIDEASKATATEVVIPVSRARRTILVGDERQLPPFHGDLLDDRPMMERFDLSVPDIEETVFGRFAAHAPPEAMVELDLQHRMTRPIGDMISHVFYGGRLRSARDGVAPYVAKAFGRALAWLSTSKLDDRGEQPDGTSFVNSAEVRLILAALRKLDAARSDASEPCKVLILSGYFAQQVQLLEAVRGIESELPHLTLEVNTVDAAQGREAEVAIFSVVRSNGQREAGFLGRPERINVALSRGQELLLLVGDHEFCHQLDDPSPMRRIADYFRANRADACMHTPEATR